MTTDFKNHPSWHSIEQAFADLEKRLESLPSKGRTGKLKKAYLRIHVDLGVQIEVVQDKERSLHERYAECSFNHTLQEYQRVSSDVTELVDSFAALVDEYVEEKE